jgi:ankyrin repeat protein
MSKRLDALIVTAFFGIASLAREAIDWHPSDFLDNSTALAICWACRRGHLNVVEILLDRGIPTSSLRLEGLWPLSWACHGGHLKIVERLLKQSGSTELSKCDEKGRSPLSHAVKEGHFPITKFLMARRDVDVNLADRKGNTPLFYAFRKESGREDFQLVKYLEMQPQVDFAYRDNSGRTILSWVAGDGILGAVNLFIKSTRSDIKSLFDDSRDNYTGRSPLSWAAFNGHLEAVHVLLKTHRIDTQLASVDNYGQNVFRLATNRSHWEIIQLLLKYYPQGVEIIEECDK